MTAFSCYDAVILATHNRGKVEEIAALLEPFSIECRSSSELGLPEVEEDGDTYVDNARLKAESACRLSGLPAIADDSGVSVLALGGAPGIHTGRWAGPERDFTVAMRRVEQELNELGEDVDRRAHYVSVLCVAWPNHAWQCFEGIVRGTLVWPPRGNRGSGFEPMFLPDGSELTFGEMAPATKYATNARAVAFDRMSRVLCFDR